MKKLLPFIGILFALNLSAADIPQHISYTQIYDFVDELANDGIIEIHSVVKPYSREYIAQKLQEAKAKEENLSRRQQKDLDFYLNDYALELNRLPETKVAYRSNNLTLALIQPAFHYRDSLFRLRLTPILGAEFSYNKKGHPASRSIGADFQGTVCKYVSVFGSLRDMAFQGELLSRPAYLNNFAGYEYKESEGQTANFSDSRGGIKVGNRWGSIGLVKDNIVWGDNYHGSNILSGRAPSFPMITLQLKPVRWFQLDYFHAWLTSNVIDSTNYYVENGIKKHYRATNKFMAANMLTFTPFRKLDISIGNSIIYAENNVQPAYFIPIAFYKSIDHTLTKGIKSENQNSQMFLNISSRNIKHLHLYGSIFVDEMKFARFKSSNKETNPISYKAGAKLSNFPLKNLYVLGEYTRSNIITYKHSIPAISYTSNSYNLGNYLGDNSQEIYAEIGYKPIRGLSLSVSYLNAKHGNEYEYLRRDERNVNQISNIISQKFMKDVVWTNTTYSFKALYELINNMYLGMNITYSDIQGHDAKSAKIDGEVRKNAQGYLDLYTPKFFQGKNLTLNMMLSIGF
ncbi:hypothetical protein FACS189434_00680 [Bacteroidia bacterium]|nr:hypothetical protein FACS189434_00680 [Bacteroidia bacterium]